MSSNLVIFLGLCLACRVGPGQIQMYAEASSIPPSSDHSNPPEQYSQETQNDHESSEVLTDGNGTVEHDGFTETNNDKVIEGIVNRQDIVYEEVGASEEEVSDDEINLDDGEISDDDEFVGPQGASNVTKNSIGQKPLPNKKPAAAHGGKPVPNFETQELTGEQMVWHAGIYSKGFRPYKQICGGTLVKSNAVISAAHCFWSDEEGVLPASTFAVAAGKRYRPWHEKHDKFAQKSDVKAVHVPVRYRDAATSYQEDIAVVLLESYFSSNYAVPVCVNFKEDFDNEQLLKGNIGTLLGWGLTEEDGGPSQVLNYLEIPSVDIEECLSNADTTFLRYITGDKICAGTTGKAVCRGDSGGGLIFFDKVGPTRVPYLRGVASTAPRNEHRCNTHALAALTHVRAHRDFLRRHIPDLETTCTDYFPHAYDQHDRFNNQKDENKTTVQRAKSNINCFFDEQSDIAFEFHPQMLVFTVYLDGEAPSDSKDLEPQIE